MIYLKENKINKFNSNKIYLKDKVIYQAAKLDDSSAKPEYLKLAFAYDSFAEETITDVITNFQYQWFTSKYSDFNFTINDHYNTIHSLSAYKTLDTYINGVNQSFKNFKSILIKCNNILINTSNTFYYSEKTDNKTFSIQVYDIFKNFYYKDKSYSYSSMGINDDSTKKSVQYIYIDFNCGSEQSKVLFLNENFDIIGQQTFDTFNLSTNEDVGAYNSFLKIDFGSIYGSTKSIDFFYQCYCDKPLSIDEIKQVDKYMMNR